MKVRKADHTEFYGVDVWVFFLCLLWELHPKIVCVCVCARACAV